MRRNWILVLVVVVCLVGTTPPASAATIRAPDGDICITVAYVIDHQGHHISMISNGTIQFGTELYVESDCGRFNVSIDGQQPVEVEGGLYINNISASTRTIDIGGDGWQLNYTNLQFWPTMAFNDAINYWVNQPSPEGEYWTLQELRGHDFWVGFATVLVSLIVSLSIVNTLARRFVEREIGKEITEGGLF